MKRKDVKVEVKKDDFRRLPYNLWVIVVGIFIVVLGIGAIFGEMMSFISVTEPEEPTCSVDMGNLEFVVDYKEDHGYVLPNEEIDFCQRISRHLHDSIDCFKHNVTVNANKYVNVVGISGYLNHEMYIGEDYVNEIPCTVHQQDNTLERGVVVFFGMIIAIITWFGLIGILCWWFDHYWKK